jgi:hypothetical protein
MVVTLQSGEVLVPPWGAEVVGIERSNMIPGTEQPVEAFRVENHTRWSNVRE